VFHAEAPQETMSERLAQGPYVVARAVVEPMTLRMKGIDSTDASHMPNCHKLPGSVSSRSRYKTHISWLASTAGFCLMVLRFERTKCFAVCNYLCLLES